MFSMIDPQTLALASLIVFLGALTQSLIGFGLAVVASPLLYIVDPDLVPTPKQSRSVLIKNATVHTVSQGVLSNTDVLIENGKITAVGAQLTSQINSATA